MLLELLGGKVKFAQYGTFKAFSPIEVQYFTVSLSAFLFYLVFVLVFAHFVTFPPTKMVVVQQLHFKGLH